MKTTITLKTATALAVAMFVLPVSVRAADVTNCDKVANEVRAAIEKEPQKVLLIVEDFMVANESCACEIVKAAIVATKYNRELAQQIVQTATHVTPQMSAVIADC